MDQKNLQFASEIINPSYLNLGFNSLQNRQNIFKGLLTQRQLPQEGLDELTITYFLDQLALMDSNNFHGKIGVGERQSRIFSELVSKRNFFMGHGIGRSGDVMANQPKAAGSSLILQLTRFLTLSALKQLNYQFVSDVLLLPMATGMSLTMSFLTLSQIRPERKYVLWSRIDQKTCLKSIKTANLQPIVIEQLLDGDSLICDHNELQNRIKQIGSQNILCLVSTTSCFAPRVPDNVQNNSLVAKKYGIFHVVNNAYGLWCSKIASYIKNGLKNGECTIVVQSTDKNFLVPVGGSIIFTQQQEILKKISAKYPGRASGSPILDLFITLLSMGKSTIRKLKKQRKENYLFMKSEAENFAKNHNFRLLQTKANSISFAMNIGNSQSNITELGSVLYSKRVMGHRIVAETTKKTLIVGKQFSNYGSHHQKYPFLPYITFACAVGTKKQEIIIFFKRFEESLKQISKKRQKKKNLSLQKKQKNVIQINQSVKKEEEEHQQEKEKDKISYSQQQQQINKNTEDKFQKSNSNNHLKQLQNPNNKTKK